MIRTINLELKDDYPVAYSPEGYKLKDFSIVRGDDGTFHAFYIKTPRGVPNDYVYGLENMIGHSSTRDFIEWKEHDPVLVAIQHTWEERCVIAPFVLKAQGKWWMFYTGTNQYRGRLGLAYSTDLFAWTRHPVNPVFDPSLLDWPAPGGGGCRDPHVARFGEAFHLYYTADSLDGTACVGCAVSPDLLQWRDRGRALIAPAKNARGEFVSCSESSSVYEMNGRYLMTVKQYHEQGKCRHGTALIWSDSPTRFEWERRTQFLDRAISMELVARRGDDFLFACFSCVFWKFHLLLLSLRGERFEVRENPAPAEVARFLA